VKLKKNQLYKRIKKVIKRMMNKIEIKNKFYFLIKE
jgi:hypothetical protein